MLIFLKKFKPKTPGTRFRINVKNLKLKKLKLSKRLIGKNNKKGGRNNLGSITLKGRGGGHKRKYRKILFKRKTFVGSVCNFEYDPNRTAYLAKIYSFLNKEFFYILSPQNLILGDIVKCYDSSSSLVIKHLSLGDSAILKNIPVGSLIHNIELKPNKGGQLVRTAGNFAQLIEKVGKYARVRLRSGEQRLILLNCFASLGVIDNVDHYLINKGKAGVNRWLGKRPKVRGVAMNPVDHPHGGGEGKTSGGRPSVSFKGLLTKGKPTRKKKLNKNIVISVRKLKLLKKKSTRKGKFSY